MADASLQETYAPKSICFGCGPANDRGLRIRSVATSDAEAICDWTPEPHHHAFEGMLNGGICGALPRLPLELDGRVALDAHA